MLRGMLLVPALLCLLVSAVTVAQTPDGDPPSVEPVCDELATATPGLYGLCTAFCEAQDCEPDFASAGDPFENCYPSSERILERFDTIAEGNYTMPCLKIPCPCYDEADLLSFDTPYDLCRFNWLGVQNLLTASTTNPTVFASIRRDPRPRFQRCIFRDPSRITVVGFLTDEEAGACENLLVGFMDANIGQCTVVQDFR